MIPTELQLQVTEEELQEFPEIESDQNNINHIDNSTGKAVSSTGISDYSTASKIRPGKRQYRRPVMNKRQPVALPWNPIERQPAAPSWNSIGRRPVTLPSFKHRRQAGDQAPVLIPSIFDVQVKPDLAAFARMLTPEALRYLYLGIDLGQILSNSLQSNPVKYALCRPQ